MALGDCSDLRSLEEVARIFYTQSILGTIGGGAPITGSEAHIQRFHFDANATPVSITPSETVSVVAIANKSTTDYLLVAIDYVDATISKTATIVMDPNESSVRVFGGLVVTDVRISSAANPYPAVGTATNDSTIASAAPTGVANGFVEFLV